MAESVVGAGACRFSVVGSGELAYFEVISLYRPYNQLLEASCEQDICQ
jgi:hypothetical protein